MARKELTNFISQERPDIELVELRRGLSATHLFRIRNGRDCGVQQDEWLPLQFRYVGPTKRRSGQYYVERSADSHTGVIILSHTGHVVGGLQHELLTSFSPSAFVPRDEVLQYLEKWWSSGSRLPEARLAESLLACKNNHPVHQIMLEALGVLGRQYFIPMGFTFRSLLHLPEYACAEVGGKYRLIVRTAYYDAAQLRCVMHRNRVPCSAEENFDFLVCTFPKTVLADGQLHPRPMFVFPKAMLLKWGILETGGSRGKNNFYIYPPFRQIAQRNEITLSLEEQQGPFFVTNLAEMEAVLRTAETRGGSSAVSSNASVCDTGITIGVSSGG